MTDRLKVVRRGFNYPIGESLEKVRKAGGLSKMTREERAGLQFRQVAIGDFCDDMPLESQALYLERGDIVRVSVEAPAKGRRAPGDDA